MNTIYILICAECRINWAFEEGEIHCFLPSFPHIFTLHFPTSTPPPQVCSSAKFMQAFSSHLTSRKDRQQDRERHGEREERRRSLG